MYLGETQKFVVYISYITFIFISSSRQFVIYRHKDNLCPLVISYMKKKVFF
jgi:hypothetical protein